jgi:dienelactone hydrolase
MLISLAIQYVIIVIFAPGFNVPGQPIPRRKREDETPPDSREDVSFVVDGLRVSAYLYRPKATTPVPCIIMSTGLGGTKDALLERYALRFVEAGCAALTYDYRYFGASEGEPRQLMDISCQLDDLRAAVAYARSRPEIDPEGIVLWGTSAGGGYGIIIAAEDRRIAGVITQCTPLDPEADAQLFFQHAGIPQFLRLLTHALRDKGRSRFGLSAHRIPIVGQPGALAFLNAPGAYDGYARLVAGSETFENQVCARLLFGAQGPDVVEAADNVRCPVLILVCQHDSLTAPDSHARAAAALGDKATVVSYPIGHFDIYEGEHFENAVADKLAFLAERARPLPA